MPEYLTIDNHTVVELFELQVTKTPDNIALIDSKTKYTYKELNEKANQFARCLINKSIKQGDFVAILLDPGAEYITTLLAIIKVGAVYIPLDAQAPQARLSAIIHDASPKLIISNEQYQTQLTNLEHPLVLIKKIRLESISYSKENLFITVPQDASLYMIYTSGSTGSPKGVLIPNQAVVNLVVLENYSRVKENQRVAQYNNLAFDACTLEIWSALLHGAVLCIIPEQARKNHVHLKESLMAYQIHHILVPTGYFHQLIKSAITTLDSVEAIVFGGEAINPVLLKKFIQHRQQGNIPTQLINGYGPSEATVVACRKLIDLNDVEDEDELASIGTTFTNAQAYILDEQLNPVDEGELYLSGLLLALGYHNCPIQNKERFIENPFCAIPPFQRLYKTGDVVRRLPSGNLLFTGRIDDQVKIGGFRIHLNEIEHQLMTHPNISMASVAVELGGGHHKMLKAYLVFSSKETITHADELRAYLTTKLPAYMLPAKYVMVEKLPLTRVGKIDKKALDNMPHTDLAFHQDTSCNNPIEEHIKRIWCHLLNRISINTHTNLFDLGANSLLLTEACTRINTELNAELTITDMLAYPTIHKLSLFMEGLVEEDTRIKKRTHQTTDIAIVGMSCRFPKSRSLDEFWSNLCQGVDCLNRMTIPETVAETYVPVRGILDDVDLFDASFFGFSPSDASITDPQHRMFLECVWEALENAGIAPEKMNDRLISVFAGMTDSTYLHNNLLKNEWFLKEHDTFAQRIATSMSMLSTHISYRLNLKGRSVNVNTACSTGLITVDHACQELLMGTSDIAIAGSSSITLPQEQGYIYQDGGILSSDGVCRPFSNQANGTVFSNGVGVVILKRMEDALADKDTIYAVIKGRSVNNDGGDKLGFTAPSVHGQKTCIQEALAHAGISAEYIDYVETHGTATALGDVIEVHALSNAYTRDTDKKQFCALGSVKANIGHTDATAGIASLIKAALCLHYKKIPPLIHFKAPNPELKLDDSPFYINTQMLEWEKKDHPRHAGVSAFGIGGTNVHLILGEAPPKSETTPQALHDEILLISAKNELAFTQSAKALSSYIKQKTEHALSDIAYTLHTGREDFSYRGFAVGCERQGLADMLERAPSSFYDENIHHELVFLFSGQGTQYPGMAMELFHSIPLVKHYITLGSQYANPYLHCSLLSLIQDPESSLLKETRYAQPALFIIEYALAKTLMDLGVQPNVLIGHSLGEYVAACLSGVFSFEDGVALVCERGILMQQAPKGEMILLEANEDEVRYYLNKVPVDMALHNATQQFVLAGNHAALTQLRALLDADQKIYKTLAVEHAFHSRLMSPLEESFKELFSSINLSEPKIPIISNLTGTWLTAEEATSTEYWYRHMRESIQFCTNIKLILHDKYPLFIEVGPGQGLCQFVKEISQNKAICVSTLPNYQKNTTERYQLLFALGTLWTKGVSIHWDKLTDGLNKEKIALPTYPFQKQKYWIEADLNHTKTDQKTQIYKPLWSYQKAYKTNNPNLLSCLKEQDWIIFEDDLGLSNQIISMLIEYNINPIVIQCDAHKKKYEHSYIINFQNKSDYVKLMHSLKMRIKNPIILHCASYTIPSSLLPDEQAINTQLEKSLYSLFYLYQAYIESENTYDLKIAFITHGLKRIIGNEPINPTNASLIGASKVLMQEHPRCHIKLFDLSTLEQHHKQASLMHNILSIIMDTPWTIERLVTSYRHGYEWNMTFGLINESSTIKSNRLRDNGIYLITGGMGDIALSFCDAIINEVKTPTFILITRSFYPDEKDWDAFIQKQMPGFEKISRLEELKQKGASILLRQADINNEDMLKTVVRECLSLTSTIHGVLHTVGIAKPNLAKNKSQNEIKEVMAPKLYGTYNLAKTLQHIPLDFVVFTSSLSSELGGTYYSDYAGANSALNTFIMEDFFPSASFIMSMNWNTWNDVGLAALAARKGDPHFIGIGNDISSKEGKKIFIKALKHSEPYVFVSNKEINSYFELLKQDNKKIPKSLTKIEREDISIRSSYSVSTNETERQLIDIWEELLHINHIGINDNFFELGGHSLKSISLISKINILFDKKLPVSQLYVTPTIKELAQTIDGARIQSKKSFLIPLKTTQKTPPYLFLCHPIIGLPHCFSSIALHYDLPLSLYAFQDPSIEHNKMIYTSVKEMAKSYWNEIKKIQPYGPYFLIGYSFGGNVFHEVAHLMQQENHEIGFLAFIDSWALDSPLYQSKDAFIQIMQQSAAQCSNELIELAWQRENLLKHHQTTSINQKMILFKASKLLEAYETIDKGDNGWSLYNEGFIKQHLINSNHDTIINEDNSKIILNLIKSEFISLGIIHEIIK